MKVKNTVVNAQVKLMIDEIIHDTRVLIQSASTKKEVEKFIFDAADKLNRLKYINKITE